MATNTQIRFLELLTRFNRGDKICVEELQYDSYWDGKDESTIRRDIGVIKKFFPDSIELIRGAKGEKSCYKAITKDIFSNLVDSDTLALFTQTFNIAKKNGIFDNLNISEDDKRIIEAKIKKSDECYKFISKPFETKKSDTELLKEIEKSIAGSRYVKLIHKEKGTTKKYNVKPYKILFMQENFYLACENCDESFPFSLFRIINIQSIELQETTFKKNYNMVDFIDYIQTPRPKYSEHFKNKLVEVVLEVEKTRAKHFKAKKHMLSQKEIETKDDGTLVLSFTVTQELEMEDLIKKWIPFIRVIKPLSLKKKIDDDLKRYLNKNDNI